MSGIDKFRASIISVIVGVLLFIPNNLTASHLTGADFQYTCVGRGMLADTVIIRANVFRDCSGISAPSSITLNPAITNSCGDVVPATLQQIGATGIEVSMLCGPLINSSSCNGGLLPGMEIYTYEATVILPASCGGSLQISSTGGTPGYNYMWPMGLSGTDIDMLCSGTYIVTIQDDNGCVAYDTSVLTDATGMSLSAVVNKVSCNGACDGSILVNPSGGSAPFVYNWEDGSSGNLRTNLCSGMYSVTVMDAAGAQHAYWVNLENPSPIFINFSTQNESCVGSCDGVIYAQITGGTPPYTTSWTGGLSGTVVTGVCAGTYTLTVTDANSCTSIASVNLGSQIPLTSSYNVNNYITCNGVCNASVTIFGSGGVAPYVYTWSNGYVGQVQSGLCAGVYSVTTTDANNCTDIISFTLSQPTSINMNASATNSNCSGNTGSAMVAPTGGTPPYSIQWSTGASTPSVFSLASGSYTVTITDANGCIVTETVAISDIGGPLGSGATLVHPTCFGSNNGSITLTPTGGQIPYSYSWNNGTSSSSISSLTAGEYLVTITSANGCKWVEIFEIISPDSITASISTTAPMCNGSCDGMLSAIPTGGFGGYNIVWSNGGSGLSQTNLCAGTYSVTISDGNNCSSVLNNIILANPMPLSDTLTILNPIDCSGDCDGQVHAEGIGGTPPYSYDWSNGSSIATIYDQCAGAYPITVTDANGCIHLDTANITQPTSINPSITQVTTPICTGIWSGGWGSCCRPNGAVNITTTSSSFYSYFVMNQSLEQGECNSGVEFEDNPSAHPLRYVCLNDTVCYNFGVTEPDGDSLVFELVPALTGSSTIATYNSPYSGANPINGITLNSSTGEVCFVATPLGRFVVAIKVTEYDPVTGLYKGENMRDILFIVQQCSVNSLPQGTEVQNLIGSGGVSLVDTNTIEMCEGDSFCFEIVFTDSNLFDTGMFVFSNVGQLLNGPNPNDTATVINTLVDTLVVNNDSVLRITSTVCWTAPPGSGGTYNFYVGVNDDHCTVPKDFFRSVTVTVIPSTVAWPDQVICGNQTAQIFATGGTSFGWNAISGDSIIVGQNFSCDSCASPVASPSQTTVYVVTTNVNSACQNTDTVTVTVAPDYQVTATPDTILCYLDTVQLMATASIPGVFTYQWNNSSSLTNDTIANPLANPPGSTVYSVTMTSADGCQKNSTANITILPPFPGLNTIAVDTVLCGISDSTQIDVEFIFGGNLAPCSGSYSQCLSTTNYTVIGTGTLSNTASGYSNSAPFGNFRKSSRQQYLIRASELIAQGLSAGMITEIGFNVAAINGASTYQNFEIKMGCVTNTQYTSINYFPTPVIVFPASNVSLSTGWNQLVFSTPYIWDGTSSLVIDVCFDMLNANSSQNSSTYYNSPGYTCMVYNNSNFSNMCISSVPVAAGFSRPNIRFGFCAGADTAAYLYTWGPNYNLSDTSIKNPYVWPDSTFTYTLVVNDTFGVCSDTADLTIYVGEIDAGTDTVLCMGDSVVLDAIVTTICPYGTETYSWFPATGLSDPSILNPTATVIQTTTYTLTYTNSCGCTMVDSVTITVNPMSPPSPVVNHPTCGLSDGEIVFNYPSIAPPYIYSIDSGNTFSYTNSFTGLNWGIYYYQVADSNGCLSPIVEDTLINPGAPVINSVVWNDPTCYGYLDGQISILASGGTPPLSYSIDSVNFTLNSLFTGIGQGSYVVVVQDDSLCQTFPQFITLSSNNELLLDSVRFENLGCYQDSSGWIQVHGHGGTGPLMYSINNGISYTADSLFTNLSSGLYPVIIKDTFGCTSTMYIQTLTEPSALVATLSLTNDTCYNACGGEAEVLISGGTQPYMYHWKKGVNPIGFNYPIVSGLCAGTDYEVKITDSNNCEIFEPFIVTHPDQLVANAGVIDISCYGKNDASITVSATGGTPPYMYSIDGGATYHTSPIFSNLTSGTYNVFVADSGQRCTASIIATVNEPAQIILTTNIQQKTLCVAGCTQLIATAQGGVGPPFNYIWNQGLDSNSQQTVCPTATTIYSIYAVDSNGCTTQTKTITLNLRDSLQVDAGPSHDICPGDTAQLNALVTGGDQANGYNYVWTPVSGLSGGYVKNPVAYPLSSTLYKIKVTDNCETPAAFDSVWVKIHPDPVLGFYADGPTSGCEPFTISLVNTSTPVQFAEWTIGDDIKVHGFRVDVADLREGTYDLHLNIISPFGCESDTIEKNFITVHPLPDAKFVLSPQKTTMFNTIIQFQDQSIGDIHSWLWDFSGFGTSNNENPTFQFPADTGTFPITLAVTSTDGCVDTQVEYLRIGSEFNFYVPSSFTPNGDGQNDVFAPQGVGIDMSTYKLVIYNRWGSVIFESSSLYQPWDGRVQGTGKMAPNGVYIWRIVAQDNTDNPKGHEYQGTVTLIR